MYPVRTTSFMVLVLERVVNYVVCEEKAALMTGAPLRSRFVCGALLRATTQ